MRYKNKKQNKYKTVSVITPKVCPYCKSSNIVKAGFRYNGTTKKQRWLCRNCGKFFTVEDGFKKMKKKRELITASLDLYMNGMSLRKVRDHFNQFSEQCVSHQSVLNWLRKYGKRLKDYQQNFDLQLSEQYHADEIFIPCNKKQDYLFDMIDKGTRVLVSSFYSTKRDSQSAKILFLKARHKPLSLFTDGMRGYPKAFRKVWGARNRKLDKEVYTQLKADVDKRNNIVERIQGTIRERIKVMRGFKVEWSADLILSLFVVYYNFVRIHQGIKRTPIEEANINLNLGQNKWLGLIYHANQNS